MGGCFQRCGDQAHAGVRASLSCAMQFAPQIHTDDLSCIHVTTAASKVVPLSPGWHPVQDADSSDSSESDDSVAPVPAAKRQRLHRDGTASTATEEELAIAAALAKDRWGRFGGRDGKMARIRAQEQLASANAVAAAVTGQTSAAGGAKPASSAAEAAAATACEVDAADFPAACSAAERSLQAASSAKAKRQSAGKKAKRAVAKEGQDGAAGASEPSARPAGPEVRPRKRRKLKDPAVSGALPNAAAPDSDRSTSEQAPAQAWWGAGRFVSSGSLIGLQRDEAAPVARPREEFSESTQVHLRGTDVSAKQCDRPVASWRSLHVVA